jgi:hypothetical protein
MADDAETPVQHYVRRAAENRGIDLDRAREKEQASPSGFFAALDVHGTDEDMASSMRLLAARDTEDDRVAVRRLVTLSLRDQYPEASDEELDDVSRKLLAHLRGSGLKRAS